MYNYAKNVINKINLFFEIFKKFDLFDWLTKKDIYVQFSHIFVKNE